METGEMIFRTVTVDLECGMNFHALGEVEMTTSEQKVLWRGVAAGIMVGFALGLMAALFISIRPELFRALLP
ncbi:MAG TPA: hypothetical protein VF848_02160 [Steroidobacteraceae bacterium]